MISRIALTASVCLTVASCGIDRYDLRTESGLSADSRGEESDSISAKLKTAEPGGLNLYSIGAAGNFTNVKFKIKARCGPTLTALAGSHTIDPYTTLDTEVASSVPNTCSPRKIDIVEVQADFVGPNGGAAQAVTLAASGSSWTSTDGNRLVLVQTKYGDEAGSIDKAVAEVRHGTYREISAKAVGNTGIPITARLKVVDNYLCSDIELNGTGTTVRIDYIAPTVTPNPIPAGLVNIAAITAQPACAVRSGDVTAPFPTGTVSTNLDYAACAPGTYTSEFELRPNDLANTTFGASRCIIRFDATVTSGSIIN